MATNIEAFDHLVGRIFADLYDCFPMKDTFSAEFYGAYLMGKGEPKIDPFFDDLMEAQEFAQATVEWLNSAGYLSFEPISIDGVGMAVLTAKGLEALKSVPNSLSGDSLGSQLIDAAKAGTIDQLKSLAGQAISTGLRIGTTWAVAAAS